MLLFLMTRWYHLPPATRAWDVVSASVALVLSVVAAQLVNPALVVSGFAACALFLAVASLVGAGLAALRGGGTLEPIS
jgi:hypothetical protein